MLRAGSGCGRDGQFDARDVDLGDGLRTRGMAGGNLALDGSHSRKLRACHMPSPHDALLLGRLFHNGQLLLHRKHLGFDNRFFGHLGHGHDGLRLLGHLRRKGGSGKLFEERCALPLECFGIDRDDAGGGRFGSELLRELVSLELILLVEAIEMVAHQRDAEIHGAGDRSAGEASHADLRPGNGQLLRGLRHLQRERRHGVEPHTHAEESRVDGRVPIRQPHVKHLRTALATNQMAAARVGARLGNSYPHARGLAPGGRGRSAAI